MFIYTSFNENLSGFHLLAIMQLINAIMNVHIRGSMPLTLLSIYERAEMLDHMVILHLIFKKLANFSKAVACFTFPPGRNCL